MNTSRMIAVAALSLSGSSLAIAGTVDLAFTGSAIAKNIAVELEGNRYNVRAGQLLHNVANDGTGFNLASQILTYCTDLTQTTTSSMTEYTVMDPKDAPQPGNAMGAVAAQMLARLYAYERSQADNAFSSTALQNRAAAFQVAVWEIVYDSASGLDAGSGDFQLVSGFNASLLTEFFNAATDASGAEANLRALVSQDGQDQLIVVPLPGAGAMAFAGLAGLAGVRRRR